ncbi:MAG: carboxypeptidase-like regulatory domain-containing protein [Bacteroidota bacterium]
MKSLILVFFLLFLLICDAFSQKINGQVFDQETDSIIPFASVYFDNSFNGAVTHLDGKFSLEIGNNEGQEIVISCLGYESTFLTSYDHSKFYKIYLTPVSFVLDELTVKGGDIYRRQKEKLFKREFLGDTPNGKNCRILNIDDVNLLYDSVNYKLKASSNTPLQIVNIRLGYQIKYYLNEFYASKNELYIEGFSIFKEDETLQLKEKTKQKFLRRRKSAYLGSRMHFIRALWNGQLKMEGFKVRNLNSSDSVFLENLVENENEVKFLNPEFPLKVNYKLNTSILKFKNKSKVFIKENGFFDPKNVIWNGDMSRARIGDLLPYEYESTP